MFVEEATCLTTNLDDEQTPWGTVAFCTHLFCSMTPLGGQKWPTSALKATVYLLGTCYGLFGRDHQWIKKCFELIFFKAVARPFMMLKQVV